MHLVISRRSIVAAFGPLLAALGLLGRREDRLIAAAKNGDREAFDALRQIYSPLVNQFIYRRVREAERDDLVQDTWVGVWESLDHFEDKGKFKAWVLTIAFRRVQDFHRKEHLRPHLPLDLDHPSLEYREKEFGGVELRSVLAEFWEACSLDQRELLTMYYAEGLTLAEIGKVSGKNLNTVKYQFYKVHSDALLSLPEESHAALGRGVIA